MRGSFNGIFLTAFFLASAAAPPASGKAETTEHPGMKKLRARFNAARPRIDGLLARLKVLESDYTKPDKFDEASRRRLETREALEKQTAEVRAVALRMEKIGLGLAVHELIGVVGETLRQTGRAEPPKDLGVYILGEKIKDTISEVSEALARDESAYRGALETHDKKERRRSVLRWGGAVLLTVLLGYLGSRLALEIKAARTRARIRLLTARPASAGATIARTAPPRVPPHCEPPKLIAIGPPISVGPDDDIGPGVVLGGHFRVQELRKNRAGPDMIEAVDTRSQTNVFIIPMRQKPSRAQSLDERFAMEAIALTELRHPNIVRVLEPLSEEDRHFMVFEHLIADTLEEMIESLGRVSYGLAKEIACQTTAALKYAHANGVLHRDLTPASVLLGADGEIKVIGFGIASRTQLHKNLRGDADKGANPAYTAPEQQLGTTTRRSDVFAMGACFYEMVAGRPPFRGPDYLGQKKNRLFKPPSSLAGGLPRELDDFFHRCLSPDPEERCASAAAALSALEALPEAESDAAEEDA